MPQHLTSRGTHHPPSEPHDSILIARAKAGEREAFALLVQRHGKAVLHLIDKMIQDRTIVEDLWQETFVRALENGEPEYASRHQSQGSSAQ